MWRGWLAQQAQAERALRGSNVGCVLLLISHVERDHLVPQRGRGALHAVEVAAAVRLVAAAGSLLCQQALQLCQLLCQYCLALRAHLDPLLPAIQFVHFLVGLQVVAYLPGPRLHPGS